MKYLTLMGVSPPPLRPPLICCFLNRYWVIIMFSAGAERVDRHFTPPLSRRYFAFHIRGKGILQSLFTLYFMNRLIFTRALVCELLINRGTLKTNRLQYGVQLVWSLQIL